jgi:acetyltransferase-like isoleucine patch superfamily enzyme
MLRDKLPPAARTWIRHRLGRPEPFVYPEGIETAPPEDLVTLGRHSYHSPRVEWYPGDVGRIRIGAFCSIHHTAVVFAGGDHNPDWVTTFAIRARFGLSGAFRDGQPKTRGDVVIGNDVWAGYESVIMNGVSVGDGAIIGARSVVSRDVPDYAIVAGNPAEFRRWRFDEPERQALARIRWWEWPDSKIAAEVVGLSSSNISAFVARHDPKGPV